MRLRLFTALLLCLVVAAACSSSGNGDNADAPGDEAAEPTTDGEAEPTPEPSSDDASEGDEPSDEGEASADAEAAPDLFPENALIIGVISDRTGLMRALDEPALEAARVQVARVNERGGVLGRPLVLSEFDSRSQLNASYQAATELVSDGAELFFVTCDYQFALPAIEIATAADRLVLSPCGGTAEWGNPAVAGRNVFSFAMPSANEGVLMADYVLEQYGSTVTMIVDSTDPDAQAQCAAFEETFRRAGGGFRGRLEVDIESAPDLEEDVASLVRTSFELPDAVVLCASPTVGADVVLFLRRSGLESPIVAGSTMDGDSWIVNVERTGEMDVLSYASVFGDDPDPAVDALFDEYEVLTGERPDQGRPVTGADAIEAFALAAERAGSLDLEALIAALESFDRQKLVAGTLTFSETAHISSRAMRLMNIVDRQPQFAGMIEFEGEAPEVPAPTPEPTEEPTDPTIEAPEGETTEPEPESEDG